LSAGENSASRASVGRNIESQRIQFQQRVVAFELRKRHTSNYAM